MKLCLSWKKCFWVIKRFENGVVVATRYKIEMNEGKLIKHLIS